MTDDEKIALIALLIGDIQGSPYYPLFSQEQYKQFLLMAKGNVDKAVVSAAISASFVVSTESTREAIGDLSISSSTGTNYLKALQFLITNSNKQIPSGLMPWVGGLGQRNKLLDFRLCDGGYCGDGLGTRSHDPRNSPLYDVAVAVHDNRVEIDKGSKDTDELKSRVSDTETSINTLSQEVDSIDGRVTVIENGNKVTLQRVTDLEGNVKYVSVDYLYGGENGSSE